VSSNGILAVVSSSIVLIATCALLAPTTTACPTPPGDCVDNLPSIIPNITEFDEAPTGSFSMSTNISFNVGPSHVWANLSANATAEDDSHLLHVELGVPSTLQVTIFPSNQTTADNASVWVYSTDPNLFWKHSEFQVEGLDLVTLNATVFEFEFLLRPSALKGDHSLPVNVTIGNQTETRSMMFSADEVTTQPSVLPLFTFLGGLLLGAALIALVAGVRSRRGPRPRV